MISFTVWGHPKGKESIRKDATAAHLPEKTRQYMAFIKRAADEKLAGIKPTKEDCRLVLRIYVWGKQYPDNDNVTKAVKDCLSKRAYCDDKQVASEQVERYYVTDKKQQRIEVEVSVMERRTVP